MPASRWTISGISSEETNFADDLANATITGQLTTGETFVATLEPLRVAGKSNMRVTVSPNPLNPMTKLSFTLSKAGRVLVTVYDSQGRLVKTLSDENRSVGAHSITWDGTNGSRGKVASGVYFFRIQAPEGQEVQRVTVLK